MRQEVASVLCRVYANGLFFTQLYPNSGTDGAKAMAHTSIHGADSAPRGGPTLSKFAVEVQLSAPSPFDGRRQQNYASYQYQSQNLPPLPSNPATQLPLNLTNDYVAYNAVPATTTAVAHGNGDERVRAPRVDYQVLLLALAEEYLEASHKMGWAAASGRQERDLERYYKLIATGLGCLESLLQVFATTIRSLAVQL